MAFNPTLETNPQPLQNVASRPTAVGALVGLFDNLGGFNQKQAPSAPSESDLRGSARRTYFNEVARGTQLIEQGNRDQGIGIIAGAYRTWAGSFGVGTDAEVDQAFSAITGADPTISTYGADTSLNSLRQDENYQLGFELARGQNPQASSIELDQAALNYASTQRANAAELTAIKSSRDVSWVRAQPTYDKNFNDLVTTIQGMSATIQEDGVITPEEGEYLRKWYRSQMGKFTPPASVDATTWQGYWSERKASLDAVVGAQIKAALDGNLSTDTNNAMQALYSKLVVAGKIPPWALHALEMNTQGNEGEALKLLEQLQQKNPDVWITKIKEVMDMSYPELKAFATEFEYQDASFLDTVDTTDWKNTPDNEKVDSMMSTDIPRLTSGDNTTALIAVTNIAEKVAALDNQRVDAPLINRLFGPAYFAAVTRLNQQNPTIGAALIERTNTALSQQQSAFSRHAQEVAKQNGFSAREVTRPDGTKTIDFFPDPDLVSPQAQAELDRYFGGDWNRAQAANGVTFTGRANATPSLTRMFSEMKRVNDDLAIFNSIETARNTLNGELPKPVEQPTTQKPEDKKTNGRVDSSTPEWQQENLTIIRASNGQKWQVNKAAAAAFQGFIAELESMGYNPVSSGGYNYRNIRGSNRLSEHATGNAIDINATVNALGSTTHDFPPNVSEIAAKYGLAWGGDWKRRPDPMHFEYIAGREGTASAEPFNGDVAMQEPTGPVQSDFATMAANPIPAVNYNFVDPNPLAPQTQGAGPQVSTQPPAAMAAPEPMAAGVQITDPNKVTPTAALDPAIQEFIEGLKKGRMEFNSEEELNAAISAGKVKKGDIVFVGGRPREVK